MRYSKAYYQLKAIIRVCQKQLHTTSNPDYLNAVIAECESSIEEIEMEYGDDSENQYTGDIDELEVA